MKKITYKDAGVDTEGKDHFIDNLIKLMRKTYDPAVIESPWGFAGFYSLKGIKLFEKNYKRPVLVSCTDGVGTKLKIAFMMNKHDTVGIDLVAMSVNDLIVSGAIPLFFLDYIATGKIEKNILTEVTKGIVEGCQKAGCALLGGETAEMPGFYKDGEYDLAGFVVGIVEKSKIIDGSSVKPGDEIIGVASSGLHSNGYSLVRKILFEDNKYNIKQVVKENISLGEELLRPTRIYVKPIKDVLRHYKIKKAIKAIANITGGGMIENIPRTLPKGCSAEIYKGTWDIPYIFSFLGEIGNVSEKEMYRVFNMGIGIVLVVDPYFSKAVVSRLNRLQEKAYVIGEIKSGSGEVKIL